jgi:hypothetical protein
MRCKIKLISLADIPQMALETAHWNGLIKHIYTKGGKVTVTHKDGVEIKQFANKKQPRGDVIIRDNWTSNEEMLNVSINALLMALSPGKLSRIIERLFSPANHEGLHLCEIGWVGENTQDLDLNALIGNPDICLISTDQRTIYLLELKINAKKSNGKYSLQQHMKYTFYKDLLKAAGKEVRVGLLVPDSNRKTAFLHTREVPWFTCKNGLISPKLSLVDDKPVTGIKGVKSFDDYKAKIQENIDKKAEGLLSLREESFNIISFNSLLDQLHKEQAGHLADVFSQIQDYAAGN